MMKKLKTVVLNTAMVMGLTAGLALDTVNAETQQQKWVGDVPIMPTLVIEKGLGFAFDNAEGRIVTIYLSGITGQAELTRYYTDALDPLGWKKVDQRKWSREAEILEIKETKAAGVALWKITLRPE